MRRIARISGISHGTVVRYCQAETFPEWQSRPVSSMLDPYLEYLRRRVAEGCENAQQLWREIRQAGYPGSTRQVSKWMQNQRKKRCLGIPSEVEPNHTMSLPGLRACCYLMTTPPECLKPADALLLNTFASGLRALYNP